MRTAAASGPQRGTDPGFEHSHEDITRRWQCYSASMVDPDPHRLDHGLPGFVTREADGELQTDRP